MKDPRTHKLEDAGLKPNRRSLLGWGASLACLAASSSAAAIPRAFNRRGVIGGNTGGGGGGGGGGIPRVTPGTTAFRSWAIVPQATIDGWTPSGVSTDFGYNQRAIGGWLTPMNMTVGAGGVIDIWISAKKTSPLSYIQSGGDIRGISHVDVQINNGPVCTLISRSFHPLSGEPAFHCQAFEADFAASGVAEVRATVYPYVGKAFLLQGRKAAGPANATATTSLTDTTAGPRGYAIDTRFIPNDNSGNEHAGAHINTTSDGWSLIFAVSKASSPLPAKTVYMDTVGGSDANDGLTVSTPVQSMNAVKAIWDAAYPGGDYGGLTVLYCGAHLNHSLPSWTSQDLTPYNCASQSVTFGMASGFTKSTLQINQPQAYPIYFEKVIWNGLAIFDQTIQSASEYYSGSATTPAGSPTMWGQHLDSVFINVDHYVTQSYIGGGTNDHLGAVLITNPGTGYTTATIGAPARGTGASLVGQTLTCSGGQVVGNTFNYNTYSVSGTTYTVTQITGNGKQSGSGSTGGSGYYNGDAVPITGDGTGATAIVQILSSGQKSCPLNWSTSLYYSGHNQYIGCNFYGSDPTGGLNFTATLILACTGVNMWVNDIADISKVISGFSIKSTLSSEVWASNHMDVWQAYGNRTMHTMFGIVIDTASTIQGWTVDSNAAVKDMAIDCCCASTGNFSMSWGSGPVNLVVFDGDFRASVKLGAIGGGTFSTAFQDSRIVLTQDTFSVMNGLYTPPRIVGYMRELEYQFFPGKTAMYANSPYEQTQAPATSTEWAFANPVGLIDLKDAPGFIGVVNQGSGSSAYQGAPAFSPPNVNRVFFVYDAINASAGTPTVLQVNGAGVWMGDYATQPIGSWSNFGNFDRRRPILSQNLINGLDFMSFDGISAQTNWSTSTPLVQGSLLGGQCLPSGIVGANEFEYWIMFNMKTQDTSNPTFPRIIRDLGSTSVQLQVINPTTTPHLQAKVQHSSGTSTFTDTSFTLANGLTFVRWQVYSTTSQLTVYNAANPTGYVFNGGTAFTYPSSATKTGPTSTGAHSTIGGPGYNPYGLYNTSSFGAHMAMDFHMEMMTPNLSARSSDVATIVSKLRSRCGF